MSIFNELDGKRFDFIMADPPWSFKTYSDKGKGKSAERHYVCKDLDWIKSLPVLDIAKSDCLLWLWITNPMLPSGLEVLSAWGFKYQTHGSWVKRTKHGKLSFGTGYRLRSSHETYLIGTIGNPKNTRGVRSVVEGLVREHSRKPEEAYAAAEALMPDADRLDMFSRQERAGWTCWGDEVNRFPAN